MTTDETRRYIDELKALREKYADKIRIYTVSYTHLDVYKRQLMSGCF